MFDLSYHPSTIRQTDLTLIIVLFLSFLPVSGGDKPAVAAEEAADSPASERLFKPKNKMQKESLFGDTDVSSWLTPKK